jgi:hypothetical protein
LDRLHRAACFIIIVIGVEYFSTKNATSNAAQQAQAFSASAKIGEFDDSGLISQQLARHSILSSSQAKTQVSRP